MQNATKQMEDLMRADMEPSIMASLDRAHVVISGFGAFAKGKGKPLTNEPVQIYEDSPFWNEVKRMSDMQDRIKELSALAGAVPINEGLEFGAVELSAFARLIAEECAKVCEAVDMFNYDDPGSTYASAIRARFGIT